MFAAMRALVPVVFHLLAGCHVVSTVEVVRPGKTEHVVQKDRVSAGAPRVVVTEAGLLRFVEPQICQTRDVIEQRATTETIEEPNIAAFVVGIVATAAGGVAFTAGAFEEEPAGSPVFWSGTLGLLLGLPLAIGPWIGLDRSLVLGRALPPLEKAGAPEPCGDRPLTGRSATISIDSADVRGRVSADGVFSIPPLALLDAYAPQRFRPLEVTAILEGEGGTSRTISTVLEVGRLAERAPHYLKALEHHDATIGRFEIVPNLAAGTLRVSLTSTSDGPAVRVVLPLQNSGPGEAWGVRGQLDTPIRALDKRMIYFGHIAKDEVMSREVIIPVAPDVASMLRGATIQVAVELRDGHGTAPETLVKFDGAVLIDAPRP